MCARMVTAEIQCFQPEKASLGITARLKIDRLVSFSFSPGARHILAAFIGEKTGSPASVRLFDVSNFQTPLSQKSFYRADSVQYYWNAIGTNVLIFTHTDVDKTGQSYYGETNLFYLSITGNFDCKVELNKAGPIFDVAWSPNSKEFIVVYGTMPAKCTLFDHKAAPMYELGCAARNQVKFNHTGRLFFIAGFGNLAGDMDIWDRKTFQKLVTINASNSSSCEWSPDGSHLMASTLYQRLKVDNGIKLYHYTGGLVHEIKVKEMYQTGWRPESGDKWPEQRVLPPPPAGTIVSAPAAAPVGKYRPPGARNGEPAKLIFVIFYSF